MDQDTVTAGVGVTRSATRRRKLLIIAIGLVVVLIAAVLWFLFGGERASQQSEDAARARLGSAAPATGAMNGNASAGRLSGPPAFGLYRFTGDGTEETSFPPLTEKQGPQMPATVTAAPDGKDGCWIFRIDYNNHHWQDWDYCTSGGQLIERGGTTFSRRDVGGLKIDNTSPFVCATPVVLFTTSDPPGTTHERSCTGTSTAVAGETIAASKITVVGDESMMIGGKSVKAVHISEDMTFSGAQVGGLEINNWFDAATGLPLRGTHRMQLVTSTAIGDITYHQEGSFELQSIEPS